MSFDIADYINNFSDRLISVPTISTVVSNPVYTSVVIGIIVVILIMLSGPVPIRVGLWTTIISAGLLYLVNKKFEHDHSTLNKTAAYDAAFSVDTFVL